MPPATELLDDRDHAKNDDERQDAVELHVPSEDREDAVPRRAGRCRGGIVAKDIGVDAGIGIATARPQGPQRPPAATVVVLDLFAVTGRREIRTVNNTSADGRAIDSQRL